MDVLLCVWAAHAGEQVDAHVAWNGRSVPIEIDHGMTPQQIVACAWNEAAERGYDEPTSITLNYADEE